MQVAVSCSTIAVILAAALTAQSRAHRRRVASVQRLLRSVLEDALAGDSTASLQALYDRGVVTNLRSLLRADSKSRVGPSDQIDEWAEFGYSQPRLTRITNDQTRLAMYPVVWERRPAADQNQQRFVCVGFMDGHCELLPADKASAILAARTHSPEHREGEP